MTWCLRVVQSPQGTTNCTHGEKGLESRLTGQSRVIKETGAFEINRQTDVSVCAGINTQKCCLKKVIFLKCIFGLIDMDRYSIQDNCTVFIAISKC